jgi:hypothetical protein
MNFIATSQHRNIATSQIRDIATSLSEGFAPGQIGLFA